MTCPSHHGLGLPHPYWEQGLGYLWNTLMVLAQTLPYYAPHWNTSNLKWVLGYPFLSTPLSTWSFLATPCWLKTLWHICDYAHLSLCPATPIIPSPPQCHDGTFMDTIIQTSLPKSMILAINCCCIAHQAFYCLDVANGWVDAISPRMLLPATGPSYSLWNWQPEKPSKYDWVLWRQFLRDLPCTANSQLLFPLGTWSSWPYRKDFIPFDTNYGIAFQPGHGNYWCCLAPARVTPALPILPYVPSPSPLNQSVTFLTPSQVGYNTRDLCYALRFSPSCQI